MRVINVVGARPNFMKVAPVHAAMLRAGHEAILVHTGQHYDEAMSSVFFKELGMPEPDVNLGVGSASHAVQTARIMQAFEPTLQEHKPDIVLVAGDVNSTIACALVAVKLGVRVAHLEAGLRSGNRAMPEEVNRILTDRISDVLLTPSADADDNLSNEGIGRERVYRVGNAMIDSLLTHLEVARGKGVHERLGLKRKAYAVLTLHRPANVDDPVVLERLLRVAARISERVPLLFTIHPRTRQQIQQHELGHLCEQAVGIKTVGPLGYLDFLAVEADAALVLTDSGGIQEETTALGVPCLTLRQETERPVTVTEGTNTIVGSDVETILAQAHRTLAGQGKTGRVPELWDGRTAERVVAVLASSGQHAH